MQPLKYIRLSFYFMPFLQYLYFFKYPLDKKAQAYIMCKDFPKKILKGDGIMKKQSPQGVDNCNQLFNENKGHPIKIILNFYRGQIQTLIKSTFFLTLQNLPLWLIPIITSNIINIVTYPENHTSGDIWVNAAVLAAFILQNIFSTYNVSKIYDRLIRRIEYSLRSSLIEKLQRLSIMYHKNTSSGKLQSKIMRDCENIETLLATMYRNLFIILVSIIIAVVITIRKCPIVMLFFLLMVPAEILMLKCLRKGIRQRNNRFRSEIETTQSNVSEMIELILVTRAHGLQSREIKKMDSRLGAVMNAGYSLDKTNNLFSACTWVLMQMANLSCLAFTGYLAFRGKITVGEVVLYQTYFGQIVNNINGLLNLYPQITKGMESINSIGEVLYEERIETNNSILPISEIKGNVEFRDIYYKYDDSSKWILNNYNLKVKAGESIAFVGGSGAGKSTILNLLIGFDRPQEGKILIDGINMQNLDINEFRSHIAVVPQNTILFSGTIRDNITYGIDNVTDERLWEILRDVGLDDIVSGLPGGLNTYLGEHGGNMSGGQRQRISIARALLRDPKIIIFDEATSALDSVSEKKVQIAVDKMMKHCTTFLVAHRLSTIKNADRIAVIENGSISEIGTYDELMKKQGAFYYLKKLQE